MTDNAMAYRLRKQAERIEHTLVSDPNDKAILQQVAADLRAKANEMEKPE